MLVKKSYRVASRRFLTRLHATVEIMSRALDSVQRPASEVNGGVVGASVLRSRKCVEDRRGYLVRDGVYFSLQQASEEVKREGAFVKLGLLLARVVGRLFRGKWLASILNCVRERMCLHAPVVLGGDVRMLFAKSGL